MKTSHRTLVFAAALFLLVMPVWAHVVIKPSQAGVASFVTFNVSVPNEKDVATTQVKLLLPAGLRFVSPTVKPGWKITVQKDAQGNAVAIVWAGGNLPADFRDDFGFSAQVPDKPADLAWKAYQTYQGNQMVSWDGNPSDPAAKDPEALEKTGKGPYSVTHVVDDLAGDHAMTMAPMTPAAPPPAASDSTLLWLALILSVAALALAIVSLVRKKP